MPSQSSNTPVGPDRLRRGAAGRGSNAVANHGIIFRLAPSTWLVHQASQTIDGKPPPPFDHYRLGYVQSLLDLFVPLTLGGQQHNPGSQNVPLGGGRRTAHGFQGPSLFRGEFDPGGSTWHNRAL